jgi:hypothetical protein
LFWSKGFAAEEIKAAFIPPKNSLPELPMPPNDSQPIMAYGSAASCVARFSNISAKSKAFGARCRLRG